MFRTVSCWTAEPAALTEASTLWNTAHALTPSSGELHLGAAKRAAGGDQGEAQLHIMAEQEHRKRLAAAQAGRHTALESGPIGSVCLWQTGWLAPLLISNPAISKQKHPRTPALLYPDPSLVEFLPTPLLSLFLYNIEPIAVRPASQSQPGGENPAHQCTPT